MASGNYARDMLLKLESNLDLLVQQLSDDAPSLSTDFDKDTFWTNFSAAAELISHEASRMCMLFHKHPLPSTEDSRSLSNKIEITYSSFVAVFFTLPKMRGKTLHKEIHKYVLSVLDGLKELCTAIRCRSSRQLQIAGNVWEKCEAVDSLPKDNREALLTVCQEQHYMVADAVQELTEAIADADNYENSESPEIVAEDQSPPEEWSPPEVWSPSDRNVILPCSGLVKAAKACLKKVRDAIFERGDGDDENAIGELDTLADIIKASSSLVDDLVSNLYPPLNHSIVRQQASMVRTHFKDLLYVAGSCHFCSGADTAWIEFLKKAIDHNWVKINDMVLAD